MTVDSKSGDIIVARDDAIYSYGVNGRGPSYAYEGPKQLVSVFHDFVALATAPKAEPTSKPSVLRRFVGGQANDLYRTSTFALLDTDLKYVAHTESLVAQVRSIFAEWGDLFLLTLDGKVRLRPEPWSEVC